MLLFGKLIEDSNPVLASQHHGRSFPWFSHSKLETITYAIKDRKSWKSLLQLFCSTLSFHEIGGKEESQAQALAPLNEVHPQSHLKWNPHSK